MVGKSGCYYGPSFKGYLRVNQGDPLSPTIFNVSVDAFIRYWVVVVSLMEPGEEGIGKMVQELVAYFYADDGLITSPWSERL